MDDRLREARRQINADAVPSPSEKEVREALDVIRPGLIADGGNAELVAIEEDGTVRLLLQGACADCPSREMTLRQVIEPYLRTAVKGVTAVMVG